VVNSPFFHSFIQSLRPAYTPPSKTQISETLFWEETARVVRNTENELTQDHKLTLAVDGWTDFVKSLYAFNIITSDRRVYLHSLKDYSDQRHTAAFLTSEVIKVIEELGKENIAALVTDDAANMKAMRAEVSVKFPNIIGLRCMPHFINLITGDIMKHDWAAGLLKTCQSIVNYFSSHHRPNALLTQYRSEGIPKLCGYVKTRWYSAGTCIQSVLKNEEPLRQLAQKNKTELSTDIRAVVANRQFWANCEQLTAILRPLMSAVGTLESHSATLADCYEQLLHLAAAIEDAVTGPADFDAHCCAAFCRRWDNIGDHVYLLAYFLHPRMRGRGISSELFPRIARSAATIWKDFGNSKLSTMKLMSQIMKYKAGEAPYNLPFADEFMSATLWWQTTEDCMGSELKILAVQLLSITPHSAACERTFSILGWIHSKSRNRFLVRRLEAMGSCICTMFHIRPTTFI